MSCIHQPDDSKWDCYICHLNSSGSQNPAVSDTLDTPHTDLWFAIAEAVGAARKAGEDELAADLIDMRRSIPLDEGDAR